LATVSSQAVVCFRGPLKIGIACLVGPRQFRFMLNWSWRSSPIPLHRWKDVDEFDMQLEAK
jgi:hypothetical protein